MPDHKGHLLKKVSYWLVASATVALFATAFVFAINTVSYFSVVMGIGAGIGAISAGGAFDDVIRWAQRRRTITRPAGYGLGRLAQVIFGKKIYTHVIEPQISDHQIELYEALETGDKRGAALIPWRCRLRILMTIIAQVPFSLWGVFVALWKLRS
jgi:hypothetical protein